MVWCPKSCYEFSTTSGKIFVVPPWQRNLSFKEINIHDTRKINIVSVSPHQQIILLRGSSQLMVGVAPRARAWSCWQRHIFWSAMLKTPIRGQFGSRGLTVFLSLSHGWKMATLQLQLMTTRSIISIWQSCIAGDYPLYS